MFYDLNKESDIIKVHNQQNFIRLNYEYLLSFQNKQQSSF
ncbi:hypothetical protein JCM19239_6381 [Vibrio variabilis]|uniref:Uncharacterized protein n=1 Tax=Vibrio variabilis TaxID=990271 RepID=A0ABQ0JQ37_9VIBR|nr:hypothetical protein JCM19239_6381 [Vibrio variabilis]